MPNYKDYTNDPNVQPKLPAIPEVINDPERWKTREKLAQIQLWAEEGKNYTEIARNMGISRHMLQRWRNEHFEIDAAIENGFAFIHGKVEDALVKKATGYWIEKTVVDAKGEEHQIREYIQPDIKAIQYYLNNRCKDRWSGNIQHQTNIQVPIIFGEDSIRK